MKKNLYLFFLIVCLLGVTLFCLAACGGDDSTPDTFDIAPPPETSEEIIPEGTLFARCSEPEADLFSVQFVGVVPTSYVDYVGFEANKLYADGTRGPIQAVKIYTLHNEITDTENNITITSKDFGVEDGYLFTRSLENIPTDQEGLSYEITAYYVIGKEKFYTAKQTFSIEELIEEHILSKPNSLTIKDTSSLIDVQKWIKYTLPESQVKDDEGTAEKQSNTYYIGSSAPDTHGYVKMYICFAVPSANNNTVGIRYNFTDMEGDDAGVSTQLRRARTTTLYHTVISTKETLTVADFGLTEGYLAVIGFSDDVNTVLRSGHNLNLIAYYSQNARENAVVKIEKSFKSLCNDCIVTNHSAVIGTYTFIPTGYSDWVEFSEAAGNATGEGKYRIRVSEATNTDGMFRFNLQIACATPTRFAERIAYVYTAFDSNGDAIIPADREIAVDTIYPTIFDNDDTLMTSTDFGIERGYIMTMLLSKVALAGDESSFAIDAYYRDGNEKVYLASLTISLEALAEMVTIVW